MNRKHILKTLGFLITLIACIAALLVVPEVRAFLGLEEETQEKTNSLEKQINDLYISILEDRSEISTNKLNNGYFLISSIDMTKGNIKEIDLQKLKISLEDILGESLKIELSNAEKSDIPNELDKKNYIKIKSICKILIEICSKVSCSEEYKEKIQSISKKF